MAWRVYKLLFYVREANVKIRYFCVCRQRSRRRSRRWYNGPRGSRHRRRYIVFRLHYFWHWNAPPTRSFAYFTINPVPYSHSPASSILTSQRVAFSNKIKTIQFAAKRIFQYIKVSQSAISQLLPPSPGSNRRAWKRENVCVFSCEWNGEAIWFISSRSTVMLTGKESISNLVPCAKECDD